MKRLILLFTLGMLGVWGISDADFSKTYPKTGGGSGTGYVTTAALIDSLNALRAKAVIESLFYAHASSTEPILWDIPLVAPDTSAIDTTKAWIRGNINNTEDARSYYHVENFSGAKEDTLGFLAEMSPVTYKPDTLKVKVICEDSLKVALDIFIISDGDTILVDTLEGADLRTTWHESEILFTGNFARNKSFVALVRVRIDAGAWVRFSSSLRVI